MEKVVDIFTKPLPIEPFRRQKEMLGMKIFWFEGRVEISNKNVFYDINFRSRRETIRWRNEKSSSSIRRNEEPSSIERNEESSSSIRKNEESSSIERNEESLSSIRRNEQSPSI